MWRSSPIFAGEPREHRVEQGERGGLVARDHRADEGRVAHAARERVAGFGHARPTDAGFDQHAEQPGTIEAVRRTVERAES